MHSYNVYCYLLEVYTHVLDLILIGWHTRNGIFQTLPISFFALQHVPQVAIYQITDDGICKELLDLWQKGVNVTLLVSDRIVSYTDWRAAQVS